MVESILDLFILLPTHVLGVALARELEVEVDSLAKLVNIDCVFV